MSTESNNNFHAVMFVVVSFDAIAQESDFRIKKRQVVFLWWMQESNPEGLWNRISSRLNARWQTDWAIEDQAKNLNSTVSMISEHSAHSTPLPFDIRTWLCLLLLISMLAHASDFRIDRRWVVFLCGMQDSNPGLWNRISSRLNARWQTDLAIEDQAKNLNSTSRPYHQRAFSPLHPAAV